MINSLNQSRALSCMAGVSILFYSTHQPGVGGMRTVANDKSKNN